MNKITFVFILLAAIQLITSTEINQMNILDKLMDGSKKELFKTFHFLYKKDQQYSLNSDEGIRRYNIFKSNLKKINEHNQSNSSYQLGITIFADLTNEEFQQKYLMNPEIFEQQLKAKANNSNKFMARSHNTVNYTPKTNRINHGANFGPARDQGGCGSCWSFATAGAVEGNYKKQFGELLNLSTQQMVDCDTNDGGCNGGWPTNAFDYLINNGVALEKDYPYESGSNNTKGTCRYNQANGLQIVTEQQMCDWGCNIDNWIDLLKEGPLEVAIDGSTIQLYRSGVFDSSCEGANHAVVAYGFDYDDQGDYYMIRNSWSTGWGENGNLKVRYNPGNRNSCNVGDLAWLPRVKKYNPNPNPNPNPQPTSKYPLIYEHCPYAGRSVEVKASIPNLQSVNMDLNVSSIKVGDFPNVTLYEQTSCMGASLTLTKSSDCLAWDPNSNTQRWNDRARSISILKDAPPQGCVWVYEDCCFARGYQQVCNDVADFSALGFDNKIASIKLGSGVKGVIIYKDAGMNGDAFGVGGDLGCVDQGPNGASTEFRGQISSLRLIK